MKVIIAALIVAVSIAGSTAALIVTRDNHVQIVRHHSNPRPGTPGSTINPTP